MRDRKRDLPPVIKAIDGFRTLILSVVGIPLGAAVGIAYLVLGNLAGRIIGVVFLVIDAMAVVQFARVFGWGRRRPASSADPPADSHPHGRRDD